MASAWGKPAAGNWAEEVDAADELAGGEAEAAASASKKPCDGGGEQQQQQGAEGGASAGADGSSDDGGAAETEAWRALRELHALSASLVDDSRQDAAQSEARDRAWQEEAAAAEKGGGAGGGA